MPSAENCTAYRFHQEIDQGAQNALAFLSSKDSEHCSIEAFTSHQQLIYYIRSIFICQELFQNFFSKLLKHFFQNSNFSDRCLLRNSLFSISNSKPFVKNFFHSFQIFSVRPPCLSATALIEYHRDSPPVNNFFHFSAIFFDLAVFCYGCYNVYNTTALRNTAQISMF